MKKGALVLTYLILFIAMAGIAIYIFNIDYSETLKGRAIDASVESRSDINNDGIVDGLDILLSAVKLESNFNDLISDFGKVVIVTEIDEPPFVGGIIDLEAGQGETIEFPVPFADDKGVEICKLIVNGKKFETNLVSLQEFETDAGVEGQIVLSARFDEIGDFTAKFSCTDTRVNTAFGDEFILSVLDVNPPDILEFSPIAAKKDSEVELKVIAEDNVQTDSCTIDGVEGFSVKRTFTDTGDIPIQVKCSDIAGNEITEQFTVQVFRQLIPLVPILGTGAIDNPTRITPKNNLIGRTAGGYKFIPKVRGKITSFFIGCERRGQGAREIVPIRIFELASTNILGFGSTRSSEVNSKIPVQDQQGNPFIQLDKDKEYGIIAHFDKGESYCTGLIQPSRLNQDIIEFRGVIGDVGRNFNGGSVTSMEVIITKGAGRSTLGFPDFLFEPESDFEPIVSSADDLFIIRGLEAVIPVSFIDDSEVLNCALIVEDDEVSNVDTGGFEGKFNINHRFDEAGKFNAWVRCIDKDGNIGLSDEFIIEVEEPLPSVIPVLGNGVSPSSRVIPRGAEAPSAGGYRFIPLVNGRATEFIIGDCFRQSNAVVPIQIFEVEGLKIVGKGETKSNFNRQNGIVIRDDEGNPFVELEKGKEYSIISHYDRGVQVCVGNGNLEVDQDLGGVQFKGFIGGLRAIPFDQFSQPTVRNSGNQVVGFVDFLFDPEG